MNDEAELIAVTRRLLTNESPRLTAGRLLNLAAFILAETGISNAELAIRLQAAFLGYDHGKLDAAIACADELARSAH